MVEIGNRPIIWHIMKYYAHYGFDDFIIACGYLGGHIKNYFRNYVDDNSDLHVDLGAASVERINPPPETWKIRLIDTGPLTMTGGRLKRLKQHLQGERFMLTYGDGLSTVDINALIAHHEMLGKKATISAVRPPARFGNVHIEEGAVTYFAEKTQTDEGVINGGFMVLEPSVLDYLSGDDAVLETDLLETLAVEREIAAYQHDGFWQCLDTQRDKGYLNELWQNGEAPWHIWP